MIKKYLKKTAEYALGNAFNKTLLILLIPIFTKNMLPEEYAVYSNFMIFITFAGFFYSLGLQQSIFSHFYDEHTDEYRYTFINSVFITIIFFGIFLSLFVFVFRNFFAIIMVRSNEFSHLFYYIPVIIFCDTLYSMTLNFLNIMEQSRKFAILSSIRTIILVTLIIFYAITHNFSIQTIFLLMMIAAFSGSLAAFICLRKYLKNISKTLTAKHLFSMKLTREILKFGLIMIPGAIAMHLLRISDRYMITYLGGTTVKAALHQVGIYSLGYRVGLIMQFVVSLISLVYFPYAMKISKTSFAKESYRKLFKNYIIIGGIFAFIIILFSREIFQLFVDERYWEGIGIVAFGVISSFLTGVFNILNISFYIRKSAKSIALAVSFGAILNISLNFIFIPLWGNIGAGFSSIISFFFIVIYELIQSERIFKIGNNYFYIQFSLFFLAIPTIYNLYCKSEFLLIRIVISILFAIIGIYFFLRNYKEFFVNEKRNEARAS
ncbi:MAG: oligosaccharide flippase family protein [Candidatus Cloacimonetes bacterium]|nr:oligosaccharide flippase family protein [Candidatus Cloacimonadota bacterium]